MLEDREDNMVMSGGEHGDKQVGKIGTQRGQGEALNLTDLAHRGSVLPNVARHFEEPEVAYKTMTCAAMVATATLCSQTAKLWRATSTRPGRRKSM